MNKYGLIAIAVLICCAAIFSPGALAPAGLVMFFTGTTLAINKPRAYELGDSNDLPAIANDIIYEGAVVGLSSGYARPLVAGDAFQGFAERKCDNTGGSAGDKNVRVRKTGSIEIDVTGVTAVTDVGSTVYASDDDTFTLASTGNSSIGKIERYVSGTTVVVRFEAAGDRSI